MHHTTSTTGTLFVIATPLGHLDDLSPRARDVLGRVAIIAAEDTRTSRKLLPARESPVKWVALHEHNETRALHKLLDSLAQGHDIALVSDCGTPLISDPGFRLVRAAREADLTVSPIPGPCALIAALSVAGLPTDRFWFEGFLPAKSSARRTRLEALSSLTATLGFYVPARDLPTLLEEAGTTLGRDRDAVIARELTKRFETVLSGSLSDLATKVADDPDQCRGEAVLLIAGADESAPSSTLDAIQLARELSAELPAARAARILSRLTGMARRDAYAMVEAQR